MKSIFLNNNFYNLSDPQPTWLFTVRFYHYSDSSVSSKLSDAVRSVLIPTSVTMPQYHTDIVTKNYLGTEKSFPVIRKYGGDGSMTFDVRSEPSENNTMYALFQIGNLYKEDKTEYLRYRSEFENSGEGDPAPLKFSKIIVEMKRKNIAAEDDDHNSTFIEYINCVITDFKFNESMDYSSESKLTCELSFHYDLWNYGGGKFYDFKKDKNLVS